MISERPAEVEDRAVPGHWEGDLLLGKLPTAIATLVERSTRFCQLVELPEGHSGEAVRDALVKSIGSLPKQLRRSLTWDQGKEMLEHAQFTIDSGVHQRPVAPVLPQALRHRLTHPGAPRCRRS
jgi:IS30 family transposase